MQQAQASLLVSPTRISFEDRTRSQKITLINTSDKVRTYRLSWTHKRAQATGGYKSITNEKELAEFNKASDMLRFSPRQVTLKPGERQKVALSLRRPKGLLPGEYRSHLSFTQLPQAKQDKKGAGTGISIEPLLGYTVPVVVRHGNYDTTVKIQNITINKPKKGDTLDIQVNFKKTGSHGTYGKVHAFWQPNGKESEKRVAALNNYSIYHELAQTSPTLIWTGEQSPFNTSGTLRIIYKGDKEFRGSTWDEKSFKISPNMIISQ